MTTPKKPIWRTLAVVGLLGGAGLYVAARLPLGSTAQMWLLLLWVGLFYAVVAAWIRRNSEMLEAEPSALDMGGRPIIDTGVSVFTAEPTQPESPRQPTLPTLNNIEAY